jgi:hypothetical protein
VVAGVDVCGECGVNVWVTKSNTCHGYAANLQHNTGIAEVLEWTSGERWALEVGISAVRLQELHLPGHHIRLAHGHLLMNVQLRGIGYFQLL